MSLKIVLVGLWETLLGLSVKNLSFSNGSYYFRKLKAYHDSSMSRSLAQLSQLETLRMHLSEYIDLLLPLSLDHVTVCFDTLNPSELRQLVNKLSAWTHSLECRFELCCGYYMDTGIMHIIPSEEYIPIQQELEAMQHVDVKRFRIYNWTTSTSEWSERDSVVDDGDHGDEIVDEQFCADFYRTNRDGLSRISIRLKINCA
ncbi:hypothetical protein DPMN_054770 [Dreissena polymorpha]|uniref:Uncharacterized protein n=1 Tax=Dreissena polymorpha TaxID=45954 RepID=A0A9D4CNQ4_DREPO|nr:hypothetical protein DPMN_054770 [Dreissena polymorpha]